MRAHALTLVFASTIVALTAWRVTAHASPHPRIISLRPAEPRNLASVLLISGDGGWGSVERDLAKGFLADHLRVIGIDSQSHFTLKKSVDAAAALIAKASASASGSLLLVGYSFGADLVPLIWPSMSPELKNRIVKIVLIAPTHDGSTQIDPSNRYDTQEMVQLAPHHARLPKSRLICVFGAEEGASGYSSCPTGGMSGAHILKVDGGHDLGGNGEEIAHEIARLTWHAGARAGDAVADHHPDAPPRHPGATARGANATAHGADVSASTP